jgi:hypothetical protein
MQFTKKQYQILKENKRREPTLFLTITVGLDSLVALFAPSLVLIESLHPYLSNPSQLDYQAVVLHKIWT